MVCGFVVGVHGEQKVLREIACSGWDGDTGSIGAWGKLCNEINTVRVCMSG